MVRQLAILALFLFASEVGLAAQQHPAADTAASARLSGTVRTSANIPIPVATLRVTQTSTGKAWLSWTDENGKFDLAGLPLGHFRIEASQTGFAAETREIDLTGESAGLVDLKLEVLALARLTPAPNPIQSADNATVAPGRNAAASSGAPANSTTPGAPNAPRGSPPLRAANDGNGTNPPGGYRRQGGGRFVGPGGPAHFARRAGQ